MHSVSQFTPHYEDLADDLMHGSRLKKDGVTLPQFSHRDRDPQYFHGMQFGLMSTKGGGAAIGFESATFVDPKAQLFALQGYMQGPAAGVADKIFTPLVPLLKDHHVTGLSYAHGNRGTPNTLTRQGRYTVNDIQRDVSADLRAVNERRVRRVGNRLPTVLMGHSQGGQHVAHILANPEQYGLTPDQIRGVILMNSMLLPDSQPMVMTPGFAWNIARKSLGHVAWSIVSGRGLLFRGQKAFDTFVGEGDPNGENERRVTENTFPDSGLFFAQTVTTGTSPSLKDANLRGLPVSVIVSQDDQLMSQQLQHKTADYLDSLGANVQVRDVPGKHFSPIVTFTGEPQERVDAIMAANRQAYEHAFRNIE